MIRIFFTYLLPLLLPTVLYFLWMLPSWRAAKAQGKEEPLWHSAPWLWLFASGVGLIVIGLVFFGAHDGAAPSQSYQPPHMEDDKLVPGRFENGD